MRTLARYSLENSSGDIGSAALWQQVGDCVDGWLASKTKLGPGGQLLLRDGRPAKVFDRTVKATVGQVRTLDLIEPHPGGFFKTSIAVASDLDTVCVSCELAASSATAMPHWVDVRRPRLILSLLGLGVQWTHVGTSLRSQNLEFIGPDGGDVFVELVWSPARSLPVVAISEEEGLPLHPTLPESLADDLAGLAIVARLTPEASWRLTSRKGKDWTCFGGAIRLYWPLLGDGNVPFRHPLWTAQRLMSGVAGDTEIAADRIRGELRKQIFGVSAFGVRPPALVERIEQAANDEKIELLRERANRGEGFEEYTIGLEKRVDELQQRIAKSEEENKTLREINAQLQLSLRYQQREADVLPSEEAPPTTVAEAVETARERFNELIRFGSTVADGIADLATDAGPPDKILHHLGALAQMAEARRAGSLGTSPIAWLDTHGVSASGETKLVMTTAVEVERRTWDDGLGIRRTFEYHTKPAEGTSPDRCVRIYFLYDEERKQIAVGWIGRHP